MTARVLVRQGGAVGAGTTDFNVFTPPKGAPAFDHPGTTLLSGGMRWADGEAAAATFKILDPNGELPRSDGQFNLPAHALVTFTEDASGCAHWWHRGRMSGPINYGRGAAIAGSAREFDATSDDGNVELKGQAFVEAWVRPQETDYERLVALQAYTLNGTSSTATYHRDTCEVVVLDSHLCKNANTVTMPATTYPIGTQPLDVVADCATTAGKDYGVVIHEGGWPTPNLIEEWTWDGGASTYTAHAANTLSGIDEVLDSPITGDVPGLGAEGTTYFGGNIGSVFPKMKVSPGDTIRISGYIFNYWTDSSDGQMMLKFFDGLDNELSSNGIGLIINSASWQPFDGSAVAPAGAVYYYAVVRTYPDGSGPGRSYFRDQFRIYGPGSGSGSDCDHLCLQYIVPTDLTTNPCSLKISDQRSEVDEDTATPPTTYAPRWLNGKAGTWDTQDQLSGLIYQYQTATGSGTIFTQNTSDINSYDYWVEAVSDSLVGTPAAAVQRAPAILATRRLSHVTGKVSVPLAADQLHLIQAGMAISIKSAAFIGSNPYAAVTMRIVQALKEPRNDGTYWVHMELNRPQRMVPNGNIGGAVGQPTKATIVDGTFAGDSVQQALEALAAGTTGPLTTLGDMLYRGTGGSNTRLPIGPSNTHLRSDGTKPVWSPESPALTNPMTTAWDLIRGGVGGTPTRFALGASNTVLSSDGSQFLWDVKPSGGGTGLTDPMTTIGDIIVRNASNVTARLGIGASNTVLTSLGSGAAPVWATGGGGGGSNTWPPLDNAYALDGTYGDHFTGASLNVRWTRRNYTSGAESYQVGPNGTYLRISSASRAGGDGYLQTAPAGDWTFAMAAVYEGRPSNFGLAVVDTNGTGLVGIPAYSASAPNAALLAQVTTYTTYGGAYVEPAVAGTSPNVGFFWGPNFTKYWMLLRKSGTNYYVAISLNGELWSPESAAIVWAGTVDRVGMLHGPIGSLGDYIDVDWFNKIA